MTNGAWTGLANENKILLGVEPHNVMQSRSRSSGPHNYKGHWWPSPDACEKLLPLGLCWHELETMIVRKRPRV